MDNSESLKILLKWAIYHRRWNPKPKHPLKWKKPYRPLTLKKAPKVQLKDHYDSDSSNKTPTTKTIKPLSASAQARIAAMEIKLAFGYYAYKYLQDILGNGGKITIEESSAPSLVNAVKKLLDAGYLVKESKKDNQVTYKLTSEGFDGVKEILSDLSLRNPKTLKTPNRY